MCSRYLDIDICRFQRNLATLDQTFTCGVMQILMSLLEVTAVFCFQNNNLTEDLMRTAILCLMGAHLLLFHMAKPVFLIYTMTRNVPEMFDNATAAEEVVSAPTESKERRHKNILICR